MRMISTFPLKRGLARKKPTFIAITVVDKESSKELVLEAIQYLLDEYHGIMPKVCLRLYLHEGE